MRLWWYPLLPGLLLVAAVSAAEPKDETRSSLRVELRGVLNKVTLNGVDSYTVQLFLPAKHFSRLSGSVGVALEGKLRDRAAKLVGKKVVITGPVVGSFLDRASNVRLVVQARTLEEVKER